MGGSGEHNPACSKGAKAASSAAVDILHDNHEFSKIYSFWKLLYANQVKLDINDGTYHVRLLFEF
jgi:hypothetical protein